MKSALISVYAKDDITEFARFLDAKGYQLLSTGGTLKYLREQGLYPVDVSEITGFQEMLDGRVKTLHPKIHGGLLAKRDNPHHIKELAVAHIHTIDMLVVNLYPFVDELHTEKSFDEKLEFIDIGGPAMLRSAAKNFKDVVALCNVSDYRAVMDEIDNSGDVSLDTRKKLAGKAFNLTSAYDAAISGFLLGENAMPEYLNCSYKKKYSLRYGENPHQQAAFYVSQTGNGIFCNFNQLGGKQLSFNNIRDMDTAWKLVSEFAPPAACALKHSTPCGVAVSANVKDAFRKAFECDPVSIFGGIVAVNRQVTEEIALQLSEIFLEIIIAPSFDSAALSILKKKSNLRLITLSSKAQDEIEMLTVDGGILLQNTDRQNVTELKCVTEREPDDEEMTNLLFGRKVVKHAKSNAIVLVRDGASVGIGSGEVNRVWAAEAALNRAGIGGVMASDAFFPFDDVVKLCARQKISAIIQPGGSIRDADSIKICNEHNIAMVFTGLRNFKH